MSRKPSTLKGGFFGELFAPLFVLLALGVMVIPVSPGTLDILLVSNLVFSFGLLVAALLVKEPIGISALPPLLLVSTLVRLSLNVASTRLILSGANAGEAIEAFGKIVVQDNLIVGVVIFLIITLVQFLVIAKGAERVAEVSARFTLDALPGKQMAIDADVRAGLIDFDTARARRDDLQTESRFYGALDGAMKFIKGDAIAALVITATNMIAGLITGVAVREMSLTIALKSYALLTIGDALISQIPALFNAIAAGLIVTRVVKKGEGSLANELLKQFGSIPRVPMFMALGALAIAFFPGMPSLVSLTIAGVVSILGVTSSKQKEHSSEIEHASRSFYPHKPVLLSISTNQPLEEAVQLKIDTDVRQKFYNKTGLPLSEIKFLHQNDGKITNSITILLRGLHVFTISLEDQLKNNPEKIEQLGKKLAEELSILRGELIDDNMTRRILADLSISHQELIAYCCPNIVSIPSLTSIFRKLAEEGVPLFQLELALQAVSEINQKSSERILLEAVRIALKRSISTHFSSANKTIEAIALSPEIDLTFLKAERGEDPLNPEIVSLLAKQVYARLSQKREVILCSARSRRLVYECLHLEKVDVIVLGYEEICDDFMVKINQQILNVTLSDDSQLLAA
jgi:type III secretion protein V